MRVFQLDEPLFEPALQNAEGTAVLLELTFVKRDQLEVRLRRRVHLTPLHCTVLFGSDAD